MLFFERNEKEEFKMLFSLVYEEIGFFLRCAPPAGTLVQNSSIPLICVRYLNEQSRHFIPSLFKKKSICSAFICSFFKQTFFILNESL